MGSGRRRLVLLLSQLSDFDTLDYAQALVPVLPALEAASITPLAIAIGNHAGADHFRAYTGFAREPLVVVSSLFIDSPVMRRLRAAGLSVVASKVFHEARSGAAVVAKRWGVC